MHDVLGGLGDLARTLLADGASGSAPADGTVKAALIGGVALILATAITAFASTFQRHRQPAPPAPVTEGGVIVELRRRAETAERDLARTRAELKQAGVRIDFLESLCWDNQVNPHSGKATTP